MKSRIGGGLPLPDNLRVSSPDPFCDSLLEWDAVDQAQEYYVYRVELFPRDVEFE